MIEDVKKVAPTEKKVSNTVKKQLREEAMVAKIETFKPAPHPGGHPARK